MRVSRRVALGATASLVPGFLPSRADPYRANPTAAQWRALDQRLAGDVLLPGGTAYDIAKQVQFPRFDAARPLAVVRPTTVADVATSLRFAGEHALAVRPRSGGHCYEGSSTGTATMVLDVRRFARVSLNSDGTQATIGAGAGLLVVHEKLARGDKTIPTGLCPTVGAAGLTFGGGHGVEDRAWGLTCDRLVSARVVLADGRALTTSPSVEPELFWALRGGGGQFAVATHLTFRTHPAVPMGHVDLTFPDTATADVIAGTYAYLDTAPRTTWLRAQVQAVMGTLKPKVYGVCAAGSETAVAAALAAQIGSAPTTQRTFTLPYLESVAYFAGGRTTPRRDVAHGSEILATVGETEATQISAAAVSALAAGRVASIQVSPLTGAVADVAVDGTAFPFRRHTAVVQSSTGATGGEYAAARAWLSGVHTRLAPISSGAYLNYVEPGRGAGDYLGTNLPRVAAAKRRYDPLGRFPGAYTVGP